MTRSELLAGAKPILFNSDMVRAILAGKKTQTRRLITSHYGAKMIHPPSTARLYRPAEFSGKVVWSHADPISPDGLSRVVKDYFEPRYNAGDILYVRETWAKIKDGSGHDPDEYAYKADNSWLVPRWTPGLHMPKNVARIFLRVEHVSVERLWDITDSDALAEGAPVCRCEYTDYKPQSFCDRCEKRMTPRQTFMEIWDGTIKQKNRDTFGWRANPWVWVYTFERVMPDEEETS